MRSDSPVVSVAICLHNSSRFIDETLDSVFAQTFQDFQLVLVDDGSMDGCAERIERRYRDSRVTLIRQRHQGLGIARQASVAHSAGEYVAFLDHDDRWLPTKLERQLAAASAKPAADLVFSNYLLIDAAGREIGCMSDRDDLGAIDVDGTQAHIELLRRGCFITLSTVLARTEAVRAVGGFNTGYRYVEDYDLWLRLARLYRFRCVDEALAEWRMHEGQFTRQHPEVALAELTDLLLPLARSSSYPPSVRRIVEDNLFGQHRESCRRRVEQKRVGRALHAVVGIWRYPGCLSDYCRHVLRGTKIGALVEWSVRASLHVRDLTARGKAEAVDVARLFLARARRALRMVLRMCGCSAKARGSTAATAPTSDSAMQPTDVWIDGSPLGGEHTGYFNFVTELVRALLDRTGPACTVHVITQAAGRAALAARLDGDASRLRFHRLGWRALHWSELHRLCFGWTASMLVVHLTVALLALGWAYANRAAMAAGVLLLAGHAAVLIDELTAAARGTLGRPATRATARLVRFIWRRLPRPRGRRPARDTIEVIVWRGSFRWAGSRRIAIIQDMTTRIHPELHTAGNVEEFDEFLGYVQRHAHTIATVSECSRRDIVERIAVCPDSVSVIPMPINPVYIRPRFSRGVGALHGITCPYVLCVGSIEPRKNLRRLVSAFELIMKEESVRDHVLVLVGPHGWDPDFRRFLVTSDAYPRVRMPGFVPLEHLPSLYHFASAVIYPSVYEGFGLPVLEAMCASGVVLASRISALPEVLGDAGLQFNPYATEEVAAALLNALRMSGTEASDYRRRCRSRADALLERWAEQPPLPGLPRPQVART